MRYQQAPDVLSRRSLCAVVLLSSERDEPISVGGSGPDIWAALETPRTIPELASMYGQSVDAPTETHAEVTALLQRLATLGLVTRVR